MCLIDCLYLSHAEFKTLSFLRGKELDLDAVFFLIDNCLRNDSRRQNNGHNNRILSITHNSNG